ncbi:MAG: hypothetical protein KAK00_07130 [Nanoarchaeota archaeon]|nr:hypothetical protein [Nanoarchaeota archaeon]
MKKLNLILIFAIILVVPAINTTAWIDCSVPSCPAGYTDNGEYCTGSICYRNCTGLTCDGSWNQVHDNKFGFEGDHGYKGQASSTYTSSDSASCYQFKINAGSADFNYNSNDFVECDGEAIAGFRESGTSHPWYENLTQKGDWDSQYRYWGDVSGTSFDYFFVALRSHTETDSYEDNSYDSRMRKDYSIYCAPTAEGCSNLTGSDYLINCDISCYSKPTYAYIHQSAEDNSEGTTPWSAANTNLRDSSYCGSGNIDANYYRYVHFRVYTTPTIQINNDQSCERANEAPQAANVKVIPINPTAGDDLICNYTYFDSEGFEEKDSIYEWWKNNANQNINSRILKKGNLTIDDNWYCKVTPNDGLLDGTKKQSSNSAAILSTVENPMAYINEQIIWNSQGYYSDSILTEDFSDELNDALVDCIPDEEGYCDIPLVFSSESEGKIELSDLEIYYNLSADDKKNVTIPLSKGWNLFSLPVLTDTDILQNLNYSSLFSFDNVNKKYLEATQIEPKKGYWLNSNEDKILDVFGEEIENKSLVLEDGWNLVGYPYIEDKEVGLLFNGSYVLGYDSGWHSYYPDRSIGSLGILEPGKAYWVKKE